MRAPLQYDGSMFSDLRSQDVHAAAERIRGHARFVDDRTLDVDGHTTIEFDGAVIATGSSPSRRSSRSVWTLAVPRK